MRSISWTKLPSAFYLGIYWLCVPIAKPVLRFKPLPTDEINVLFSEYATCPTTSQVSVAENFEATLFSSRTEQLESFPFDVGIDS